jgi:hypothetical protein
MPENQFTSAEQSELFTFTEGEKGNVDKALEVLNTGTKDEVLIQLVQKFESVFVSIEDQGNLLEDKIDEHLNPEEEKEAQADYDREVNPRPPPVPPVPGMPMTSDSDYIYQVLHCTYIHGQPYMLPRPLSYFITLLCGLTIISLSHFLSSLSLPARPEVPAAGRWGSRRDW